MKISIPNGWLNMMANAHESAEPKEVALIIKSFNSQSKMMLKVHIADFILHEIENGNYEP